MSLLHIPVGVHTGLDGGVHIPLKSGIPVQPLYKCGSPVVGLDGGISRQPGGCSCGAGGSQFCGAGGSQFETSGPEVGAEPMLGLEDTLNLRSVVSGAEYNSRLEVTGAEYFPRLGSFVPFWVASLEDLPSPPNGMMWQLVGVLPFAGERCASGVCGPPGPVLSVSGVPGLLGALGVPGGAGSGGCVGVAGDAGGAGGDGALPSMPECAWHYADGYLVRRSLLTGAGALPPLPECAWHYVDG